MVLSPPSDSFAVPVIPTSRNEVCAVWIERKQSQRFFHATWNAIIVGVCIWVQHLAVFACLIVRNIIIFSVLNRLMVILIHLFMFGFVSDNARKSINAKALVISNPSHNA